MKGKFAFVVGASLGYVLGSRAGRERYEQIRRGARKLWNTTPVQKGAQAVRGVVDERADDLKVAARRFGSQLLAKMAEQTAGKTDGKSQTAASDSSSSKSESSVKPVAAQDSQTAKKPGSSSAPGSKKSAAPSSPSADDAAAKEDSSS